MHDLTSGPRESWRPLRVAAPLAATALLVMTGLMLGPLSGPDRAWVVVDVGIMLVDGFAVVAATIRFRRSPPGPVRRAWLLILAAIVAYCAADGIWGWYDLTGRPVPYPSVADLFYVAAAVPALLGLLLFPVPTVARLSRTRLLIDAVVVSCALALISFMVVLRDVFASLGTGLGAVVNAFYPVSDLLFVCVASLLLLRGGGSAPRLDLVLLGLGFTSYAFADSAFAVVALEGSYDSSLVSDVPYLAAPLLLGLAALVPPPSRSRPAPTERAGLLSGTLPDLAVLAALVTSLTLGGTGWGDRQLVLGTVVLAIMRQVWLGWENHSLRAGLEARVDERTAENRALAARFEHIVESVAEGILGIDGAGRIAFVNTTGLRLLATTSDRLVGTDACESLHGVGSHASGPCQLVAALDGQVVRDADQDFLRPDGSTVAVEMTADRLRDGADAGVVVVFRDDTDRRATEQMKSEFISVVSHELRTPLTSIHGALHLLRDGEVGDLPEEAGRVVDVALRGSDRLSRLVNDILVMDRLESGALPLDIAEHDAGRLTAAVLTALEPVAGLEGVTLSAGPVRCGILVDPDRFMQVLTNLVGNALKFTPTGGDVRVEVTAGTAQAAVSVTDTGPGIPVDAHELVFERFRQLDDSDVRRREGSGLGLAITRALVEHLGGRIWVESEPGHGSTFTFTVPLSRAGARGHAPGPAAGPGTEADDADTAEPSVTTDTDSSGTTDPDPLGTADAVGGR